MARIPESELDRLRTGIDLTRLVESDGHTLKRIGKRQILPVLEGLEGLEGARRRWCQTFSFKFKNSGPKL